MKKNIIKTLAALTLFCCAVSTAAQETEKKTAQDTEEIRSLLRTIRFEFNSAALAPSSHKPLDSAAILFKQDSELRYEVQGHTDCKGNPDYNKRLSMARAVSVKNYLVTAGVPVKNIVSIGYGAEVPVSDNTTEKGRAANRRVEVVLIDCHDTYNAMRETEANLLEEVRQADIKGFEELTHDIVDIPENVSEPQPIEDIVIEDKPADAPLIVTEVTAEPDTAVTPAAEPEPAYSSRRHCSYLISGRPELLIVLGEISTVGAVFEFGLINKSGLLLSLDFGGGIHYYGAGLNLGYSFTPIDDITAVFGFFGSYHRTDLVVYFNDKNGKTITQKCGLNKGYGGVFWKILPHNITNFDITNRILIGRKRDSAWYDKEEHEIFTKSTHTVTYSLTAGITLIKRSK